MGQMPVAPRSPYHGSEVPGGEYSGWIPRSRREVHRAAAPAVPGPGPVVTACLWRRPTDGRWHHGTVDFPEGAVDPDGATSLFSLLVDRSPEAFQGFAEDYHEVSIDLAAVNQVHALRPLNQELVTSLSLEVSLPDLARDISAIGYPRPDQGAD